MIEIEIMYLFLLLLKYLADPSIYNHLEAVFVG